MLNQKKKTGAKKIGALKMGAPKMGAPEKLPAALYFTTRYFTSLPLLIRQG